MNFYDRTNVWFKPIKEYIPLMKDCEQDETWHSEGGVLTHTKMVLDEVEKINSISDEDREILNWVALLHDIGKIYTTEIIDGKVSSPRHSKRSYHIAMGLLDKSYLSDRDKLEVLNLIRLHGKAAWIDEQEDPYRYVIKLSMSCRIDLLYHFSRCDFLGRITNDVEEFLEKIEYFKEIAMELDCYHKPYTFANNITKFNYLVKETYHHTDVAYDDTKSKVFMVCGLPGSGKDTYIVEALTWLPVISLDEIRKELKIKPTGNQGLVIQTAKERAREYMRKGEDFVWNTTSVTRQLRSGIISLFTEYNSFIRVIFINKPIGVVLKQNNQRENPVPENIIKKLHKKMEIPTDTECHELTIIF